MHHSAILMASFLSVHHFAFTGFFGAQNICFKKGKTVFFCCFLLILRSDGTRVFPEMAGLANRALYEVF
jgi:hypothetical protein